MSTIVRNIEKAAERILAEGLTTEGLLELEHIALARGRPESRLTDALLRSVGIDPRCSVDKSALASSDIVEIRKFEDARSTRDLLILASPNPARGRPSHFSTERVVLPDVGTSVCNHVFGAGWEAENAIRLRSGITGSEYEAVITPAYSASTFFEGGSAGPERKLAGIRILVLHDSPDGPVAMQIELATAERADLQRAADLMDRIVGFSLDRSPLTLQKASNFFRRAGFDLHFANVIGFEEQFARERLTLARLCSLEVRADFQTHEEPAWCELHLCHTPIAASASFAADLKCGLLTLLDKPAVVRGKAQTFAPAGGNVTLEGFGRAEPIAKHLIHCAAA